MSPEYLGLILLAALLTGIFVGFPIAFTLIIPSVVFGYLGIGPQVFYLVVPEWELSQIYRGMFEFMCLQVVGLVLLFFFPQIALWLPSVLNR